MVFSKYTEMFAESIPAGVLQAYAFAQSPNRSTSAALSILISAATTGFGSALASYGKYLRWALYVEQQSQTTSTIFLTPCALLHIADLDTSPTKRQETPEFYGFVPPTGRGFIFLLMVINSTAQFLSKIMSIALLGAVSKTWAFGYLLGDIALFLIYTLIRNDFIYFIPVQSYTGSIAISLLVRIVNKVRETCRRVNLYTIFSCKW